MHGSARSSTGIGAPGLDRGGMDDGAESNGGALSGEEKNAVLELDPGRKKIPRERFV